MLLSLLALALAEDPAPAPVQWECTTIPILASGGLIAPAECAMHLVDFLLDEDFGREAVVDLRDLGR